MIIFISDKKMSGKDKGMDSRTQLKFGAPVVLPFSDPMRIGTGIHDIESSQPKRSLSNIFEVQLWRKRKSFFIFVRFNFNGTSFAFDNVLLNSFISNTDAVTVRVPRMGTASPVPEFWPEVRFQSGPNHGHGPF